MERFLSNYKPPPPKKSKVSEEDQLEKNRKYETEKRESFQSIVEEHFQMARLSRRQRRR